MGTQSSSQSPSSNVRDHAETTYTLITGASTGLGKAFAERCGSMGMHLILVSLANEGLEKVGDKIRDTCGVEVVCYQTDLTREKSVEELSAWVLARYRVNFLINNAGIGGSMNILTADHQYIKSMIRLNVEASSMLTLSFLEELLAHRQSYVLNVSSIIALSPVGYKSVYPATKTFLYSFSRGLYQELKGSQLHVSVVLPGPLATNGSVKDRIKMHGWLGRFMTSTPDAVAEMALRKTLQKRPVIIPGIATRLSWLLLIIFPTKILLPFLSGKYYKEIAESADSTR